MCETSDERIANKETQNTDPRNDCSFSAAQQDERTNEKQALKIRRSASDSEIEKRALTNLEPLDNEQIDSNSQGDL